MSITIKSMRVILSKFSKINGLAFDYTAKTALIFGEFMSYAFDTS